MTLQDKPVAQLDKGQGFVHDLNGAIRDNPVAASLIGLGAVWMIFGGNKVSVLGTKVSGTAASLADAIGNTAGSGARVVGSALATTALASEEGAGKIGNKVDAGLEAAGSLVSDTVSSGYDAMTSSGHAAGKSLGGAVYASADTAYEFAMSMQKKLSATLERQPLALGAIGLAIGAGIAAAFPSTIMERDLMGETGSSFKEKMKTYASEAATSAVERAEHVIDEMSKESEAQGLTASAANHELKNMAEKVQTVAGSTRESIKGRFS